MRAPSPAVLLGILAASGCASPQDIGSQQQSVIYGDDDRRDVYDHPDPAWQQRARESVVALFQESNLDRSDPNNIRVTGPTLGDRVGLCEEQRFRNHPTGSDCSGTLIDDDLVLTAGHCVRSAAACASQLFVFDYFYRAEGELETISEDDVFRCTDIVARELTSSLDYAVLRLDRPVGPERRPMPVRREDTALTRGDDLAIMGFGSGIPLKIDTGGNVVNPTQSGLARFTASLDAFGGNSGSGVFDAEGNVVGILVSGNRDYGIDRRRGCTVVNELPEDRGIGEGCVYVARALDGLCEADPGARPCSSNAEVCGRCDDGICGAGLVCQDGRCFEPCNSDIECNPEEACIAGACVPPLEQTCAGNRRALSLCGAVTETLDDCGDNVCVDGICEEREGICPAQEFVALNSTIRIPGDRFTSSAYQGSCGGNGLEVALGFEVTEASLVTITARGIQGDTLLYLRRDCEDDASELLCNDDTAGRDAQLRGTLEPGSYTVFVDHFADRSQGVELRINAEPSFASDGGVVLSDGGAFASDAGVAGDAGPPPVVEHYTFSWCSASPDDNGRSLWGFVVLVGLALRRRRR